MDRSRAFKVTQALLQKTVANGCTPNEAALAAERSAAYIQLFGFVFEDAKASGQAPPRTPSGRTPPVTPEPKGWSIGIGRFNSGARVGSGARVKAPSVRPVQALWRPVVQTVGCVIGALGVLCAGCIVW